MPTLFQTKFIELLYTLDEKELKSFEKWLASPWCNSNKNLIRLLQKLIKYHPTYDDPKLTKERLFKKVMQGKTHSKTWMNNLLSEANIQLKKFLIYQALQKNESQQQHYLTRELQNRHIEKRFFKTSDAAIEKLEEKEIKDREDHLDLLKFYRRIYRHPNQNPRMAPGSLTIVKMSENLDLVYLLEKAAIINEKIFRNRILKGETHDVSREVEVWNRLAKENANISVRLYQIRFSYSDENILTEYLKLKELFLNNITKLDPEAQKIHLLSLLNDSTFLQKKGLLKIEEKLPLFGVGLKSNLLIEKGVLNRKLFVSIITAANQSEQFDFTEYVIENYVEYLAEETREDGKIYASAHLANRKKDFEKALDFLINYNFKTHYFQLAGKILTLQTYFDLNLRNPTYQSFLFSYCDSFEKWLMREKLRSKYQRQAYIRFVQKTRELVKLYISIDFEPEKAQNLLKKVDSIQPREWLLKKQKEVINLRKK